MQKPREFQTPKVTEIGYIPPHAYGVPEHDPFGDGLTLNKLGGFCIIQYAKDLSSRHDLTGAQNALTSVTEPPSVDNVIRLDDYRHGTPPPRAA